MPNWYNLLLSVLLFSLCALCIVEIGVIYESVGGGRAGPEQRIEHSYKFYNQTMITFLSSISLSILGLFFLRRFIRRIVSPLTWKHVLSILPFTFVFFVAFISNYKNVAFKCHLNYFVILGLIAGLILLLIYLILKFLPTASFEDILDQP